MSSAGTTSSTKADTGFLQQEYDSRSKMHNKKSSSSISQGGDGFAVGATSYAAMLTAQSGRHFTFPDALALYARNSHFLMRHLI